MCCDILLIDTARPGNVCEIVANMSVFVCKMCIRINAAAQLADILRHFSHSVSKLLRCSDFSESNESLFSVSILYVRDVTAALVNILAFRVRCHLLLIKHIKFN